MEFTAWGIVWTLFTALIAALGAGLTSYATSKGTMRAATEDIRRALERLRKETQVVEAVKQDLATKALLQTDLVKATYGWMAAAQSLLHSMCWLAWDAKERGTASDSLCKAYNSEAHRLIPELLAQTATVRLIEESCYTALESHVNDLFKLDAEFGKAILLAESDATAATSKFVELYPSASVLAYKIATQSGAKLLVATR